MSTYDNPPGKIFIGGISPNTTQDSIQKYFEQFGELCDCVLMQDKATGKSRCFGFVTYKDSDLLDEILSKKHSIDGKEIDCKRAIPRDQHPDSGKESGPQKTKKLFVGGLTQTTSEDEFRKYFDQFGTIEDSVIMVDKDTGKSRGFGFITFASEDSVERVIERYNDNKIDGKWVECKKAQAKDSMAAGGKKGGRHDSSRGPSDHSRHGGSGRGGGDRSRGHGSYYQNSPPSSQSGGGARKSSSRGHPSQDNYGGGGYYQGGYGGQNYPQPGAYDQGPYGGYPGYDYGPSAAGYDPSGNYSRGPGGYNYNPEYAGYNPSYGNPYPTSYNPGYNSGYPSQYQGAYPQGYDPSGMPSANPTTANPNMQQQQQQPSAKTTDPTSATGSQVSGGGAPTGQYPAGYGPEGGYNPASYGYNPMQGDYSNAGYMGYGNPGQQMDSRNLQAGGGQPKYGGGPAQPLSPSQGGTGGGYGKPSQSDIGPMRGGPKKGGHDQRYYQPY